MRHLLDPVAPHRACRVLGRMLGDGLLSRGECLAALAGAAGAERFPVDASGLRARLVQGLMDAARERVLARLRAERFVRAALREPLAARAGRAALLAAARAADAGGVLTEVELAALVREGVRRVLATGPAGAARR